ncbi:MAG: ABC transporter ATP-binding protein [Verrucomicrobia subdivision 3 bacterium]|nr:ABC transporter ATP-binding protein [Limisphaerales bacterium]
MKAPNQITVDVTLDSVSKRFGQTVALENVSLQIAPGEFLALVGPSGSGKTTLLRLIAGLDEPCSGAVRVNGHPASAGVGDGAVAMVFQTLALYPHLTARDNISLGLRLKKIPRGEIEHRVWETAEVFSIQRVLNCKPHELSGGERQRVALARAMIKRPQILLLDEPFANLDWHLRAGLRSELRRLHNAARMTVVCVTHDLLEAVALGERLAILNKGKLEQADVPSAIFERPASPFVESFVRAAEPGELARAQCADAGRREVAG